MKDQLKTHIITYLSLDDVNKDEIKNDQTLFGDGLGLDSIDALELIVMMEREYNIKIADPAKGKEILQSIDTMAAYISENS
ncbi:MAG: acyl carrier protein [Flavobacteriales bacterium]|nr:acyl carrier protein [Flavobacteriales bacterium]